MPDADGHWTPRDDVLFALKLIGVSIAIGTAVATAALGAWLLLIEPGLAWWRGAGFTFDLAREHVAHAVKIAAIVAVAVAASFVALVVAYMRAMLHGSGPASS